MNGFVQSVIASAQRTAENVAQDQRAHFPCFGVLYPQELAYALEECGEYEEAETIALEAYGKNGGDCWAAHQVAHVHEMTGRGKTESLYIRTMQ
jgi:hypothetical protein